MTEAEIRDYLASDEFERLVLSDDWDRHGAEFDALLDAGITVEAAAAHFGLPIDVFRFLFGAFLAGLKMAEEPGTRH